MGTFESNHLYEPAQSFQGPGELKNLRGHENNKTKMMKIPIAQHTTYSAYLSEADTPITFLGG